MIGCGIARGSHTMLDTAGLLPPSKMASVADVQVFQAGSWPKTSGVVTANLVANGNGYASEQDLMDALKLEAFRVRANILIVDGQIGTTSMTVGSYGGGIALANQVYFPYKHGVAFRSGQVWHGIRFKDASWLVRYVYNGSPGGKAGIKEGDEVVTVNGFFLGDEPTAWARHVGAGKPGDWVAIGFLRAGSKQHVIMTLEPLPLDTVAK